MVRHLGLLAALMAALFLASPAACGGDNQGVELKVVVTTSVFSETTA